MILKLSDIDMKKCIKDGWEWYRVIFWEGVRVGDFLIFRWMMSMKICKELCCVSDLCELVLFVNGGCFFV